MKAILMNKLNYIAVSKKAINLQSGFSLIELMVGLVMGLIMSLAIYSVLSINEGRKRTTTSLNDINQAGSYATYQLDKSIRSAGSGFTGGSVKVGADFAYGCRLDMAKNGSQLTPAASFPAPFNTIDPTIRVAPVIIYEGAAGAGGDVILTMAGSAGLGETPTSFSSPPIGGTLNLTSHAGLRANDIVLLADKSGTTISPCLIQQVSSAFSPIVGGSAVALSGVFYSPTINGRSTSDFTQTAQVINLGAGPTGAAPELRPSFNMFAVGENASLMKYDLMQAAQNTQTSANPNPGLFVDGVYHMRALYGIDNDGDPNTASLTWQSPTGAFSASNLLTGTTAAADNLKRIKAVKIGLIMRTALLEREAVSGATLMLFQDTALALAVNLTPNTYRYRTFEVVIPIRNTLMLQGI